MPSTATRIRADVKSRIKSLENSANYLIYVDIIVAKASLKDFEVWSFLKIQIESLQSTFRDEIISEDHLHFRE